MTKTSALLHRGAALCLALTACASQKNDGEIKVTGACSPLREERSGWKTVISPPLDKVFPLPEKARPDCPMELELKVRKKSELKPVPGVKLELTCGSVLSTTRSEPLPLKLAAGNPTQASASARRDKAAACLDPALRKQALQQKLPFHSAHWRALVSLPSYGTSAFVEHEVSVVWRYVAFETWNAAPAGDAGAKDTGTKDTGAKDAADDARPDGLGAMVKIVSPADGAKVWNPVTFVVQASGVKTVRLKRDGTTFLGPAWDPAVTDTKTYSLPDGKHTIELFGYNAAGKAIAGPDTITVEKLTQLAVDTTYYYMVFEEDHLGGGAYTLFENDACEVTVKIDVAGNFFKALCMEGTGRLADNKTYVNVIGPCTCAAAEPCPGKTTKCFAEIEDPKKHRWGMGVNNRPLEPLVSLASFNAQLPVGTWVYFPDWVGIAIPKWTDPADGVTLGGKAHDGCFRVDDAGKLITNGKIDIYIGPERLYNLMKPKNGKQILAILGHPACAGKP